MPQKTYRNNSLITDKLKIREAKQVYSYQKPKRIKLAIDISSRFLFDHFQKTLKRIATMKLVSEFTGSDKAEDSFVYQKVNQNKFHLLTENHKHFKQFVKTKRDIGIIGHASLITKSVTLNVINFLKSSKHEDLFGKFILIGEKEVKTKFSK